MASEEIRKLGHDVVIVVLPEPMRRGSLKTLRFTYSGEVISRVGRGVFYVGSRGSWYPNLGTTDRATFGLRFRYPKTRTIVATGDLAKEWEEGEQRCSVWTSDTEIPVAGFNYGDYQKTMAAAQGVEIEVYANRGIENVHQEVMARMEYLRDLQRRQALTTGRRPESLTDPFPAGPNFLDFDTTRFAKDIANQVASTVLLYEPILGKFPYRRLGGFSNSWPFQSRLAVAALCIESVVFEPRTESPHRFGERPGSLLHRMSSCPRNSPSVVGQSGRMEELSRLVDV